MSRINSDWIYEVFDDVSHDLTPARALKETRVLYMPMQTDIEVSRRCALGRSNLRPIGLKEQNVARLW